MSNGHHMSSSLPPKPDEDAGELIIDEDEVTNLSSDLGGPAVTPIEVSPEHAIFNSGMILLNFILPTNEKFYRKHKLRNGIHFNSIGY